ncbi:MAG: TM0106 family RecB-like putative nuclease [Cyclobacteriaceae bacterium]|nr:TM0106 family RecB-like putative nuclease [Cyclobacteriaceae bacterium SS2]
MKFLDSEFQLSASDLVNFLGCKHLTELDRAEKLVEIDPPDFYDPAQAILKEKGRNHEEAYEQFLKDQKKSTFKLTEHSNEATLKAMKEGYDYILQAGLYDGKWNGRADFLRKVNGPSNLGNYHYEIEDTKLAIETKAGSVIQLCLYSEILTKLQGRAPENMWVVKPGEDFPSDKFRYPEFQSYYQLIKRQFEQRINNRPERTYPYPVSKCSTCRWWKECDKKWHEDDHLCLIAGIQSMHLKELEKQGIGSLTSYAELPKPYLNEPDQGSLATYEKIHKQSQIQLKGRKAGGILYELLEITPERGLNRLPEPDPGDVYFDIESDHFHEEGGLEYLLGYCYRDSNNDLIYQQIWSKNKKEERESFELFIDFLMDRWARNHGFYIYHYAPYEPGAIKRMAQYHRTREVEVDQLLRGERFIDLYSVLKESLRASVESYSLKDVEKLTSYERKADLRLSSMARRRIATALEFKDEDTLIKEDLELVELYNQDDCLATEALHQFLEERYQENQSDLQRPPVKDGTPSEGVEGRDLEAEEMFKAMVKNLPDDREEWDDEHKSLWLGAHLIEYYRREKKSAFWEFFRMQDMDPDELLQERKAISGLKFEGAHQDSKRVPIHIYTYDPQEISIKDGSDVYEVPGEKVGSIYELSPEDCTVSIKKMGKTSDIHPVSVCTKEVISDGVLIQSLWKLIRYIIAEGISSEGPFHAGRDLLLRNRPRLSNDEVMDPKRGEDLEAHVLRILLNLDQSVLPIQGPPGSGKTFNGSKLIAELVKKGKRVGITAISHSVIINFLEGVVKEGAKKDIAIDVRHKVSSSTSVKKGDEFSFKKIEDALEFLDQGAVVGGVSWLWADDQMEDSLDYLFVDEAGQMSLANVLSVSKAAKNIVLLGDPQQLEQPQKGAHPEGADVSALQHVIGEHQTIPSNKGIFLEKTWRMHADITAFTSELYYEGRLKSIEETQKQVIQGNVAYSGTGLLFHPVEHMGNQNASTEEADEIQKIVNDYLSAKHHWTDRYGETTEITANDILIVAPYNAQVAALKTRLPECRIGTVDKFQGKQAPIVIYSMTSSSPEDAPRGMSFLYDPHRLNVATSRAQCLCILVASPKLFEPECHSIDQMKWANGLCKYKERAKISFD